MGSLTAPRGGWEIPAEETSMEFRFVHAADLHLDTPFSGIARVDERVFDALTEASLSAWDNLVRLTLEEGASFLLLAGDVYDGPSRALRAQRRFLDGVRQLTNQGIKVFMVHGNHDPLGSGWTAVSSWPSGMTVFGADEVRAVPVEVDGRRLATVYGISFGAPNEQRHLAKLFKRGPERGIHVGLLHTNLGGTEAHDNYAPSSRDDLLEAGLDYWALGHVHHRQTVIPGTPTWAVYPGNLQGRSPQPGELGAKGALVVTCDDEAGVMEEPRFVPLDLVRFVNLEIDVRGREDVASVVDEIIKDLAELRRRHENEGRGLIVRSHLRGDALVEGLLEPTSREDLLREVRDEMAGLEPFVWCEGIDVQMKAPLRLSDIRGRGDFMDLLVDEFEGVRQEGSLASLLQEIDRELPASIRNEGPKDDETILDGALRECLRLLLRGGQES